MSLQEKIKSDLKKAMKEKNDPLKETIRVILGELGRLESKTPSDQEIVQIMKKLIKAEKETLEKTGNKEPSQFISIIENYLPKMATEEEIKDWIRHNIDFSSYKNKMQSMKLILDHFGQRTDGNTVKEILKGM